GFWPAAQGPACFAWKVIFDSPMPCRGGANLVTISPLYEEAKSPLKTPRVVAVLPSIWQTDSMTTLPPSPLTLCLVHFSLPRVGRLARSSVFWSTHCFMVIGWGI